METDYLRIAYELAILSFYIGVLIYALPIPWPPLKRWAPRLMIDGIFISGLSIAFYTLLSVSDYVAHLLGGSWQLFEGWLSTAISNLIAIKGFVFIVTSMTSQLPFAEAIRITLRHLDRVADLSFIVIAWTGALATIIGNFGKALAAIGVALAAVPFRISRSAGVWLLSFMLVFNAGLQVLPSFLATLSEQPGRPDPSELEANGLAFARIHVIDQSGENIGNGILYMYNAEGKEWAKYIVLNGIVHDDKFGNTVPVPSRSPVYLVLEVDNVRFNLRPYPLYPSYYLGNGTVWETTVTNDYLVWVKDYTIIYTDGEIELVERGSDWIYVIVDLEESQYLAVRSPQECGIQLYPSLGLQETRDTWEWNNLKGLVIKYHPITSGEYSLNLTMKECDVISGSLGNTSNYLETVGKLGTYSDIDFISSILLYYTTIPLLYVFVLFTITTGLARTLGGRERLPVRV